MILASPRFGHPHSQNPSYVGINLVIWVMVTGDARITKVLGMGMPKSLWQRCRAFATLETIRDLGRVNFFQDF